MRWSDISSYDWLLVVILLRNISIRVSLQVLMAIQSWKFLTVSHKV